MIESKTAETKAAAKIKTHHNVGGLPADLRFSLIEPLRYLFKDEVRNVGAELGLPDAMVLRQPFPGPGLAVRIIGAVTAERLETLREADWIVIDEIKAAGLYRSLWQSFAILTPVRSVGVMGDFRTYANVVAVRAVTSDDGMTADWARLPYELLARSAPGSSTKWPASTASSTTSAASRRPPSSGSRRSRLGLAAMSSWFDKLLEELQRRQAEQDALREGRPRPSAPRGRAAATGTPTVPATTSRRRFAHAGRRSIRPGGPGRPAALGADHRRPRGPSSSSSACSAASSTWSPT